MAIKIIDARSNLNVMKRPHGMAFNNEIKQTNRRKMFLTDNRRVSRPSCTHIDSPRMLIKHESGFRDWPCSLSHPKTYPRLLRGPWLGQGEPRDVIRGCGDLWLGCKSDRSATSCICTTRRISFTRDQSPRSSTDFSEAFPEREEGGFCERSMTNVGIFRP